MTPRRPTRKPPTTRTAQPVVTTLEASEAKAPEAPEAVSGADRKSVV